MKYQVSYKLKFKIQDFILQFEQTEYMRKFQSTTSISADTVGFDQTNKNGKLNF